MTSDLAETIARWRIMVRMAVASDPKDPAAADLTLLLDAAEAGAKARDAALDECKAALRTAYVEDETGTLGMFDAIEIVDALQRPA